MKNKKNKTSVGRGLAVAAAAMCVLAASDVQAVDYTWNKENGTLSNANATDWTPNGVPGPGDTAIIGGGGTEIRANTGTGLPSQPDELVITNNARLEVSGTCPNDVILAGGRVTFYSGNNRNMTGEISMRSRSVMSGNRDCRISGLIQDDGANAGKLIVTNWTGHQLWLFNANNTYSGGTEVHNGRLRLYYNDCTGTGDVDVYPTGILEYSQSVTLSSRIVMCGGTLLAGGNVHLYADIAMKTNSLLNGANRDTWLRGVIADYDANHAGRITVRTGASFPVTIYAGNGSGNNTFSGGMDIETGKVRAWGNNNALGTGEIVIHSGATLDFNNYIQTVGSLEGVGTVQLGGGTRTITCDGASPGTNDTVAGTLTFSESGTLAMTAAATSTFHLASLAGPNDQAVLDNASGKLTMGGTLEIVDLGGLEDGDYTLFDLTGALAPAGAFAAINMPSGWGGSVATVGVDVVLTATKLPPAGTVVIIK